MIKGFKIRIYPTKEQEALMWKHVGAARYIYNHMLKEQIRRYEVGEKHLSHFDMNKLLTPLKKDGDHGWLSEVSATMLQCVCGDLAGAYESLFKKRSKRPRFKTRKRSKPSFPVGGRELYFKTDAVVYVPKIGDMKYKTDFVFADTKKGDLVNARISNVNGKWFLSFGLQYENQVFHLNDFTMGIDLGIKDSMIVAYDGDKKLVFPNINKSKVMRVLVAKLIRIQRSISRKYEANKTGNRYNRTKNIEREEQKLRKLYARISNIRRNYIHQCTHTLVALLPYRVVMETLNVRGMMKNKHLAKSIQEQCFSEIIRQMRYKCEWRGIEFVQADRFFPSSRTCHSCGCVDHSLKLSDRTYVCPECGYTEDRDYNAALNLMSYAG